MLRRTAPLALVAALAVAAACATRSEEPVPAPLDGRRSALLEMRGGASDAAHRIFATGETRGFIGPCGCEEKQFGGVARRGSYLASVAEDADLLIDLGNAAAGSDPLRSHRLTTTLRALGEMGYDAFVPGRLDLAVLDLLVATDTRGTPPVICANLVRSDGSRPFAASIEWAGTRVIGVTEEGTDVAGGRVTPAADAVRALLVDGSPAIVAAAMSRSAATALAAELDGVAIVVASGAATDDRSLMSVGDVDPADDGFVPAVRPLALAGEFAAYVRRVDLDDALRPVDTWRSWLGEDVPDDPQMSALYDAYRERSADLDPDLIPDILVGLTARGFVGSSTCRTCHTDDHATWADSLHSHGMKTLVDRGRDRDAECVPCHLVDVDANDPLSLDRVGELGIGCEACHGGRAQHVEAAQAGLIEDDTPIGAPPYGATEVCTGCHKPPEVKSFDLDIQWPRIEHGD